MTENYAEAAPIEGPLAGTRVLDLSRALAGPYATALLTDMGAEVVKVESAKGGDSTRSWPPFQNEHSLYFDSTNRGKSSIALDFYSREGQELLWQMAMASDVIVENFRPGVLTTMGLDPAKLRQEKPGLIIASVSGFGASGPLSQTAGLDQVAQGMTGLMSVTGADSGNLFRVGIPAIDLYAGIFIAFGIAAALAGKARTGVGMEVSTSLLEAGLAVSTFQGQRYLSTGQVPQPQGNDHPVLAPYGVFRTKDQPIIVAVGNDKQWHQFCGLLGEVGLAVEAPFQDGASRSKNRAELKPRVEELLARKSASEWLALFRSAKIPTGPIYNYEQVFDDPQVKALDMVQHLTRHDGSSLPTLRGPVSVNGQAPQIRKPPPALGADTRNVLAGIGLNDDQIASLIASGVVRQAMEQPVGRSA